NSKLAYKKFISIFGEEAGENKEINSPLQYPLWASTSAKNPSFHPLIYVENLIGPHTVNTVPPKTLKALMEQCNVRASLKEGLSAAEAVLEELRSIGVPFDNLLVKLEEDGVKAFADSYNKLLKALEDKFSLL
ncbi:MAG: transaldolase, partial [Candidatus Dadabacteria bacterium]